MPELRSDHCYIDFQGVRDQVHYQQYDQWQTRRFPPAIVDQDRQEETVPEQGW